ncbi:MAG: hypothetical protein AAF518_07340 [Spirochaetota bacterium]
MVHLICFLVGMKGLCAVLVFLFCQFCSSIPTKKDVPGFSPIRDDSFAEKYRPFLLLADKEIPPEKLLYRASKDAQGNIHLAYHFVWAKEENTHSGFYPFLSRNLYTGGLSLQKVLFGKEDVELISLVMSPTREILQVTYEIPENYSPSDFSVKHRTVTEKDNLSFPLVFQVISWNHLVKRIPSPAKKQLFSLPVRYFDRELWREYSMVKDSESTFNRHRAHRLYEREGAN